MNDFEEWFKETLRRGIERDKEILMALAKTYVYVGFDPIGRIFKLKR